MTNTITTITISAENQDERLDKFLLNHLKDFSRTHIQKIIRHQRVLVNQKPATVHRFLKVGDVITIESTDLPETEKPVTEHKPKNTKVLVPTIIADEDDYLIIDKPAGLLVHPTERGETDTLADWIVENYPALRQIGEDPARPAIVHRLDKDVSGLMIIPKNQDSFDHFKRLFKRRTLTKKYTALSYGVVDRDAGEINFPITRSKTKPGLFAAIPSIAGGEAQPEGKHALTQFRVIERFRNHTLLEVEIVTGRTHQIRVHLLAYGYPIVGDVLYHTLKHKKPELPRLFLQATELEVVDPSGEKKHYTLPIPTSWQNFLKKLPR